MSDDVVGFGFLAESDIPVWYLKAGETVFKEGEPAKELYVIKSGQVEIKLGNRLLATLEANDIFGEMAPARSQQGDMNFSGRRLQIARFQKAHLCDGGHIARDRHALVF